jgi:RNA polymerase-associated protein CTR9
LERKGKAVTNSKYKSAETVQDSDDDDNAGLEAAAAPRSPAEAETPGAVDSDAVDETMADAGDEDEEEAVQRPAVQRKKARIVDDDDEEEDGPSDHGDD